MWGPCEKPPGGCPPRWRERLPYSATLMSLRAQSGFSNTIQSSPKQEIDRKPFYYSALLNKGPRREGRVFTIMKLLKHVSDQEHYTTCLRLQTE